MSFETAPNHGSVARVARADADGEDQRVGLQVSNPDGIQPLIIDIERSEEAAERERNVRIGDEIELGVIDRFFNGPVEAALSGDLHEIQLEVASSFKQPALAKWDEANGGNYGAEVGFATVEGADESSATSEERDRLHIVRRRRFYPMAGM